MDFTTAPSVSLPGLALEAWEGTANALPPPMSLPAQPFTLWLSPDVWPRPALRLPGEAFTVWQNPDKWPKPKMKLPAAATTLWLDERAWRTIPTRLITVAPAPPPLLQLPAAATTLWLDPECWPATPAITPQETVAPAPPPLLQLPAAATTLWLDPECWPVPPVEVVAAPPEPLETAVAAPKPPLPEHLASRIPHPVSPVPAMNTPITLTANRSFTLWITPAALAAPVLATAASGRSPLRLPGQSFTLWTQPGRVDRVAMSNAIPPAARVIPRRTDLSRGHRWIPIAAAAALVIAALLGVKYFSEKSQRETLEADYAALEQQKAAELSTANAKAKEADSKAALAASELSAKTADFTSELAMVKTALAEAKATGEKAAKNFADTTAALDKANKALADATKEFAAKETTLQNNMTALTEETGKVKRVAGEEASKAKEAIAKLEGEKAAAIKSTTDAMAERDVLKAEVEKLRKQLEAKQKPAGAPEA